MGTFLRRTQLFSVTKNDGIFWKGLNGAKHCLGAKSFTFKRYEIRHNKAFF